MPPRIAKLFRWRIMGEDYPVPYFVEWFKDGKPCLRGDGTPDFRVMSRERWHKCWKGSQCWVCGERLGRHRAYVIGPMCAVNRTTSEPPCHVDCATWSATNCPFLTRPAMKRHDKDLPEREPMAGFGIERNPGVGCVWVSDGSLFNTPTGPLITLGDPSKVLWFARGREATKEEVVASIATGFPALAAVADREGDGAPQELRARLNATMHLLPA
jgi:hypothetical protein